MPYIERKQDTTTSNVIKNLGSYAEDIVRVSPHKRPVLLWSAASLVYVCGDLHVTTLGVLGTQVGGVTDKKLSWFLLLAVLYYLTRWAWTNWIALRSYWQKERPCRLLNTVEDKNFAIRHEQIEGMEPESVKIFDSPDEVLVVTNNRRLKADLDDLAELHPTSRLTFSLSFYGVPFIFPIVVALFAISALCYRLHLTPS